MDFYKPNKPLARMSKGELKYLKARWFAEAVRRDVFGMIETIVVIFGEVGYVEGEGHVRLCAAEEVNVRLAYWPKRDLKVWAGSNEYGHGTKVADWQERLFVPGAWMDRFLALYPEAEAEIKQRARGGADEEASGGTGR